MTRWTVSFRVALALILGLWAPLSCCCAASDHTAPDAEACHVEPAVASCHYDPAPAAPAPPPEDQPLQPCDGEGDCDCASHVAQARVSPDQPDTPLPPDSGSFLTVLPPTSMRHLDAAPRIFVLHETGPPPRPDTSLFALHCMLTI